MRYVVSFFVALALVLGASAQENQVKRIPTMPHGNPNASVYESTHGFWFAPELSAGVTTRIQEKNIGFAEADFTFGYRFSQYFKLGIGAGFRYYFHGDRIREASFNGSFPLYVTMRGNMISDEYRSVVPYWSLDAGITVRDGAMIRPTIGIRIGQPRRAFLLGISYVGQQYNAKPLKEGIDTDIHKFISGVALRLGYEF